MIARRRGWSSIRLIALLAVVALISFVAAILWDGWSKTQENTRLVKSQSQLRQILIAVVEAEKAQAELNLISLVAEGYLSADRLQSVFGPVSDGLGDYWLGVEQPKNGDPMTFVIAYDRSMYAASEYVTFAFHDGHILTKKRSDFDELLASEPNAGRDFALPVRRR